MKTSIYKSLHGGTLISGGVILLFIPLQIVSANDSVTNTPEVLIIEENVTIDQAAQIEMVDETLIVEESMPVDKSETVKEMETIVWDPEPIIQEPFQRDKIEPVKPPSHKSLKKHPNFPDMVVEKGRAIPRPPLSANALYRLYGIVEATSTEIVASTTESGPTATSTEDVTDSDQEISEELDPVATSTATSTSVDADPSSDNEGNTSSSTEDSVIIDEMQVPTKPEDVTDLLEEVIPSE
jgi:hypothetical protein